MIIVLTILLILLSLLEDVCKGLVFVAYVSIPFIWAILVFSNYK